MSGLYPAVRYLAGAFLLGLATLAPSVFSPAQAQYLCAADLNGNGDAADPGETARCEPATTGEMQCPIQKVSCIAGDSGFICPMGDHPCLDDGMGGPPACSPHVCRDLATHPIVEEPIVDDPGALPDGGIAEDGSCLGSIEIFAGRAARCRPPGLGTTFGNCCSDRGRIVHDGMGASVSMGTKIAVARGVFNGMSAAHAAFRAGATASQAASAGANALVIGIDPTSIAVSLAINFMVEILLQGCDAQDMEVGMLRGSGMCIEVGRYCTSSFLGVCLQHARGHCCFNTRLGRIIQEQGRPQLRSFNGVGWGTPRQPYCRGFTPEEFQALDFSKMDLSEYYSEIEARAQSHIQIDMEERIDAYLDTVGR